MQISRLFEIVYLLQDNKLLTAAELAERFEVSARTIYRDIEVLSAAGIPVYCAKGRGGGIGLLPGYVLNKTALTAAQRRDILSAVQGLHAVDARSAQDTLARLGALFGAAEAERRPWVEIDFDDWGGVLRARFEACKAAILDRQVLAFAYRTAGGAASRREVEPASLWFKGGTWYLKAWCRTRQAARVFRLSRMDEVRPTGERFAPRALPDAAALCAQQNCPAPVRITARVDASQQTRLYDDFAPEAITRQPDGSFVVQMEFILDEWVYGYLLSYGGALRVLAPEPVCRGVQRRLTGALQNYAGNNKVDAQLSALGCYTNAKAGPRPGSDAGTHPPTKEFSMTNTAPESVRFCQSCGMPLAPDLANCGTEADGAKSADYCSYCYGGGRFLADCTMEEMIGFCVQPMVAANPGMTEDAAREAMRQWFPTLKRWKTV